jgi:hypothetical protein
MLLMGEAVPDSSKTSTMLLMWEAVPDSSKTSTMLLMGKQFLTQVRHPPCYLFSQDVCDTTVRKQTQRT